LVIGAWSLVIDWDLGPWLLGFIEERVAKADPAGILPAK